MTTDNKLSLEKMNGSYLNYMFDHKIVSHMDDYAFVIFNIKGFRNINNLYGYDQANEILYKVFETLYPLCGEGEYFVHLYGDQFAALLKYQDHEDLIENFLRFDYGAYYIEDPRIYKNIFFSMGIYCLKDGHVSYHEALEKADFARIKCKEKRLRSSSYEFFIPQWYEKYVNQIKLEQEAILACKDERFQVYIQPKVDPYRNKIKGGEALVRWIREDGSMISPDTFLPALDENGFIRAIDQFVFEEVCKLLQSWLDRGIPPIMISVNVSKSYFYDPYFMEDYMKIFNKYQIPRRYIQFELLESITMDDSEQLQKVIKAIHDEGFSCALDDFGSGYSSPLVMTMFPFETIKLDRSLFQYDEKGRLQILMDGMIKMVQELNIELVAEGVEDERIIRHLKLVGCDLIQGFYYYRPMPMEEFKTLYEKEC